MPSESDETTESAQIRRMPRRLSQGTEAAESMTKAMKYLYSGQADEAIAQADELHSAAQAQKKVKVQYTLQDDPKVIEASFDLLVLACFPMDLSQAHILELTQKEEELFGEQEHFVFQTTLYEFPVPDPQALGIGDADDLPAVRFSPFELDRLQGEAYGYRSETRKHFNGNIVGSGLETELVTIYQLLDPKGPAGDLTTEQLEKKLNDEMEAGKYEWFPYDWKKKTKQEQVNNPFHTTYFNRFERADVRHGAIWDVLDLQGELNTMYVHGSSCFESVLHCYQYFDLVLQEKPRLLPKCKASCSILIVGAGPSGLLAARKLAKMGYRQITILERDSNNSGGVKPPYPMLAGKTQTYTKRQREQQVPCELGTCYLSPSYDTMVKDLADVTVDNKRIGLDEDYNPNAYFRQITTKGQFAPDGPVMALFKAGRLQPKYLGADQLPKDFPDAIDDANYDVLRGFEATTKKPEDPGARDEISRLVEELDKFPSKYAIAIIRYMLIHVKLFGPERPIPRDKPEDYKRKKALLGMTCFDFLKEHDLLALTGIFQYGLSVQGYGSIDRMTTMPAFYLLTWITPETVLPNVSNGLRDYILNLAKFFPKIEQFLKEALGEDTNIVTCWEKGWGDIWRQQKLQFTQGNQVKILYNANITKIIRA